MNAKDAIAGTYAMAERITGRYIQEMTDADLLVRPVPGQNHIAWHLGHLLVSERGMLEGVKPGSSPALPEGFAEAHAQSEEAASVDDPAKFLTKDKYLELMKAQREATKAVLNGLTDAELDAPGPERMRQMAPTVGSVMLLIGTHSLMHVGQYVSVRKSLKLPKAF